MTTSSPIFPKKKDKRSTTRKKNNSVALDESAQIAQTVKQEIEKCVEQTHRKTILCLLQTKLEVSIIIVCYSEECKIIELLQTKRQQSVSSSRGDVCSPLKQCLVVTKPNTRRHFYTI